MSLKLFGKNAVVYAIGNIGLRAVAFLLIPLYTHSLAIRDYGLLMTLLLTNEFMLIPMNCGMRLALVRFAKEYEKDNRISALLGTSCFLNLLAGLIVTAVSFTLLVPVFRSVLHCDNVTPYIGMVCSISLLQSMSIHLMDYYRAQNKSIKFMIAGLVSAGILLVASYMLLFVLNMGAMGALWARIAAYGIILLPISFDIFSKTGIRISFKLILELARFGFPLVFSMSSEMIIVGASVYFLSIYSGLESVAIYSLGQKLATVLAITLILPFQMSFQPFIFANLNNPNIKKQMSQLLTYLVLAISAASFCILFGSRLLLPYIAPPAYSSAYSMIILLLPGMAFIGIYYFAETLLTTVKQTKIIGLTMTACAVISIVLNYTLIPLLNQYGAIIAVNACYMLAGSLLFIIGRKKFPVPFESKRLIIAAGLFIAVILLNLALLKANNNIYCLAGITTVFAALCVLHFGSFYNEREKMFLGNAGKSLKNILPGFLRRSTPLNTLSLTQEDNNK
jgi:O-antigen/teichoic acid export membrane protein